MEYKWCATGEIMNSGGLGQLKEDRSWSKGPAFKMKTHSWPQQPQNSSLSQTHYCTQHTHINTHIIDLLQSWKLNTYFPLKLPVFFSRYFLSFFFLPFLHSHGGRLFIISSIVKWACLCVCVIESESADEWFMTERRLDFNTLTFIGSQKGRDQTESQTLPFTNSVSRANICTHGVLSKNTSLQHPKTFPWPNMGWALIMLMQLHVSSTETPQPVCLPQSRALFCLSVLLYLSWI